MAENQSRFKLDLVLFHEFRNILLKLNFLCPFFKPVRNSWSTWPNLNLNRSNLWHLCVFCSREIFEFFSLWLGVEYDWNGNLSKSWFILGPTWNLKLILSWIGQGKFLKPEFMEKNDFQDSSSVFFTFLALFHALFRPYFRHFFSHDFSPYSKFSDIMNSSMI